LQGLLAAQGLHGFFAAQGLHGLQGLAFFAAHGLHGLHGLLVPQGLHGLVLAAACRRGTAQAMLVAPPPAAQGLHGLHGLLAAHGLQGLHGFFAAQGLQGLAFFAAHGLHGLTFFAAHCAAAGAILTIAVAVTPTMATPATTISGIIVVDKRVLFLDSIFSLPDRGPLVHPIGSIRRMARRTRTCCKRGSNNSFQL